MTDDRPDYSPTAVDVVLRPEWAAKEGTDKDIRGSAGSTAFAGALDIDYTVPAGKTVYITSISVAAAAIALADAGKHQTVRGSLLIAGSEHFELGGDGGQALAVSKPIVALAGELIRLRVFQYAEHASALFGAWNGYEVTA